MTTPADIMWTADMERRRLVESGAPYDHLAALPDDAPVWTKDTLQAAYEVRGFAAPFVVVRRRADGVLGTLEFTHSPRVYFNWQAD